MMDRNREARRAAAMANGLHRRRHRTTTNPSTTLRDSPEEEGAMDSAETARLRDRVVKKERGDREIRDRDRDRERERLNRSKRRRGDKFSIREDGGFGDSSEESVNEDEDDDDDGHVRYIPPLPSIPVPSPVSASPAAGSVLSHRKSYPPPSKVYRVAPTWKAPDEMIGFSIPRKARSASTKRSHECWSSGGVVGGEQHVSQASPSPVRSTLAAPAMTPIPSHGTHPLSPSSSNVSLKKKIKPSGPKQRPPKPSTLVQDEIEIEVAEVLFGLMKQTQAPPNDSKVESRSNVDSKSRVSSPIPNSPSAPLTVVAPKRKRPRQSPDEVLIGSGQRPSPASLVPKPDPEQSQKLESDNNEGSQPENGAATEVTKKGNKWDKVGEEWKGGRNGMVVRSTIKVEEASTSSPNLESSQFHDRVQLPSTSIQPNSTPMEAGNRREDKLEIDLMTPASPEEETGDYGGGRDEKSVVTEKEMDLKSKAKDVVDGDKAVKMKGGGVVGDIATKSEKNGPLQLPPPQLHGRIGNSSSKERSFDQQIDVEKHGVNISKVNVQQHPAKIESHSDKTVGQTSSVALPMSVPGGWHGGLPPMGYVGPLQGVVSMDGTPMPSPPIQQPPPPPPPHFVFSQEKRPKRCATHCYIAKSIFVHLQLMKMNTYWPAAGAASPASLFGAKQYSPNMVPSTDLHAGRNMVSPAQDTKGQPYAFFSGQPHSSTSSTDKSSQAVTAPDSAQKKQFLVPPSLPPGTPSNIMHGPALFFPMGQQQAVGSTRPTTGKTPSTGSGAASTSMVSSAQMGATVSNAPLAGPAMSFSYPTMNGNETQFMAILGNGAYPFPIPAHVGAAPQYRGSHPQAMSFFNGSFYPSQMLHPSQLHAQSGPTPSQSMQMQQQNHQITNMPSASSTSQKHLQNQQRHQGGGGSNVGNPNQSTILQNFQGAKGRDIGGDDSPSSADSRNRQNMSLYNQNFPLPFHSPNFALIPSSLGGGATSGPGVPNGNSHGDKKNQQQQQSQQAAALSASPFPMSFTTINGANTPGLDISSMAQHHAIFQSLPEAAKQSYQMMAAAAAAQAAQQQRMNSYRGPDDVKSGAGPVTEPSTNPSTSVGQSIAFSRDLAENSVIDSSARSLNLNPGSTRPARSSASNNVTSSSNSQQQQQQHSQMLFPPKQQQYTPSTAGSSRSKNPSTSNGNVYPDNLTISPVMAAKFPSSLSGLPSLVPASGGGGALQSQWKNSVRPNTSQMSSPSITSNSTSSNLKSIPQQQGRPQQSHTQISFGAAAAVNSKPSPSPQGSQTQNTTQRPSSPMMVGSPSNSSMSKSAGGSPRTSASNKSAGQTSTLPSQQGKNSPSPSLSNQKPSILGGPHIMSTPAPVGKSQVQQQQQHQQPQLSKQSIQQAQLYFNNYMQHAANTSGAMSGTGYYLQRHRPDDQQQQQSQCPKSQGGSAPPTSASGMMSLSTPVSLANVSTSDPAKAVASNMKGGLHPQGMFNTAAQSGGAARQLIPTSSPYAHAVSAGAPVKPTEQKQPAGE